MAENSRTPEQEQRIRRRAYELWEREGRRESGAEEYWLRAEQELERMGPQTNEGEGNRSAALAFDRNQTAFAREADVAGRSAAAREAFDGAEGEELRKAEQAGRAHSHGEDPELNRKVAREHKKGG
jgi:DUF2934 family protein